MPNPEETKPAQVVRSLPSEQIATAAALISGESMMGSLGVLVLLIASVILSHRRLFIPSQGTQPLPLGRRPATSARARKAAF